MSDSESDDQDWFNKDENEILHRIQSKANKSDMESVEGGVEYIHGPSATDEYLQQKRLQASTELSLATNVKKLTTAALRKAKDMEPLDLFLFVITSESNFFLGQISASDGLERVNLYLRIWSRLCEMELRGFHKELLEKFTQNETFLEQMRVVAAKLFRQSFKTMWKNAEIDQILYDIKSLILRLHRAQLSTPKTIDLVMHIRKLINDSDNQEILRRNVCQQLVTEFDHILSGGEVHLSEKIEIYPTLEELLTNPSFDSKNNNVFKSVEINDVTKYLTKQKQILRQDFIIPLQEYVYKLKSSESLRTLTHEPELYEGVFIVLNTDFINAKRHEMLFIDVIGNQRTTDGKEVKLSSKMKDRIIAIKTGSLLLFSTSKDFENLILATVTYTDGELLCKGYIGIEFVRQYNIGTVYDRPLIMFESPAFFEPYNNVYTYFNTYGDGELPMKRYIVDDEKDVCQPRYLKPNETYTYDGESFNVNAPKPCMPKNLPLNQSQWHAYLEALTKEFCLIQGPPGTGKTHLSVHLVRTLIENTKPPIVLITYTNDSLDKFLLKLSVYTNNILRFGSQTRLPEISKFNITFESTQKEMVNPNLKRLYYHINEEFKAKFQIVQEIHANFDGSEDSYQHLQHARKDVSDVVEKLNSIRIMFQFYAARKADVIAMTSTCAAKSNFLFRLLQSKIVIFEEAAEILEPHILASLTPYTEHVIMIGDHMQLQPYTASFHHSRNCNLNVSLFERLFVNNLKGSTLTIQYRMRPCITDLIHSTFYTELKNDGSVENYPKVRYMQNSLYFYTHNECEVHSEDECSIYNDFEIKEILYLAKYLIEKAEYTADDIVILSPYAKQIERLKEKANKCKEISQLNIVTVDSFQGLEANIVLLSLVRSNSKEQIGFLREKNRICVALSRAKHGMYIIGNMSLLTKCSETWRAVGQKLKAKNAIGVKFPLSNNEE